MSVNKMGSKLAQGVRQVKAQQVSALVESLETRMPSPVAPTPSAPGATEPAARTPSTANVAKRAAPARTAPGIDKPAATQGALKPAPVDSHLSGTLHPSRVWPD